MSTFKIPALVLFVVASVAAPAHAAIDVAAVVTEAGTYPAVVAAIGGAVLIVALAVKGIKWARAAL